MDPTGFPREWECISLFHGNGKREREWEGMGILLILLENSHVIGYVI